MNTLKRQTGAIGDNSPPDHLGHIGAVGAADPYAEQISPTKASPFPGKLIISTIRMGPVGLDEHDAIKYIKQKLAMDLAEKLLSEENCYFSKLVNPSDFTTDYRARIFLLNADKVKDMIK